MAAAGAADGALGLARPAASGSRWRWNAARQDFSRIPEVRRIIGMAAAVRESLATEASRASTAARMAPASTAVASAVRPAEGLGRAPARCVTARSNPASITSTLPTDVTALGSQTSLLSAYAVRSQFPDGGQQASVIYQNGAFADQQSWSKENIVPVHGTAPVRIATRDFNSFFLGAIREVRFWNRVLTADEVQEVFTEVIPPDGLVATFLLSTDTAPDSVGGHDGQVNGGTWSP